MAATPKTDLKRQKSNTARQRRTKNIGGGKASKQGNGDVNDGGNGNNQRLIETYEKENGNFTMKIHMNVMAPAANNTKDNGANNNIADGGCQKTNLTTAETGAPEDVDHHANIQLPYEN